MDVTVLTHPLSGSLRMEPDWTPDPLPRGRLCRSDPSPSFGTQAEKIKGGWQTDCAQRKLTEGAAEETA